MSFRDICPLCDFRTDDPVAMFAHIADDGRRPYGGRLTWENRGEHSSGAQNYAKAIGLDYASGFPNADGVFFICGLKVTVHPAAKQHGPLPRGGGRLISRWDGTRKAAGHRIFVECPTCRRDVPAGRIKQHLSGTHKRNSRSLKARRHKKAGR